jgi:hypothetical protein
MASKATRMMATKITLVATEGEEGKRREVMI